MLIRSKGCLGDLERFVQVNLSGDFRARTAPILTAKFCNQIANSKHVELPTVAVISGSDARAMIYDVSSSVRFLPALK